MGGVNQDGGTAGWEERLARVHRDETGPVVAALCRWLGDLDAAEEALQEAWVAAVAAWRAHGLPERPGAWLLTAARRRALDRLRERRRAPRGLEGLPADALAHEPEVEADGADVVPDDQLRLLFTCCAPCLAPEAQAALTLRLVAGLTVPEIARAHLVPEATVAQRIVRAKRVLREQGALGAAPGARDLGRRLPAVLEVVYLLFNEGYAASEGPELLRHDLVDAARRLAFTLVRLLPAEPEVLGLAALLELTAARAPARTDAAGALVLLEQQDRSRWDRAGLARGLDLLQRALALHGPGPYQVQAAIAACHAEAPSYAATDWRQILALYDALRRLRPSPVVDLNRLVALAQVEGPEAALRGLEALAADPRLAGQHRVEVVRADLLRRLARPREAAEAYRRAAAGAANARERAFLLGCAADLATAPAPGG